MLLWSLLRIQYGPFKQSKFLQRKREEIFMKAVLKLVIYICIAPISLSTTFYSLQTPNLLKIHQITSSKESSHERCAEVLVKIL